VRRLVRHLDPIRSARRRPWLDSLLEPATQRGLLDALDHYRVLATHREGPLGVEGLERAVGARVRAFLAHRGVDTRSAHWLGRPILITENAYDVGLMNGDVGLVLPTPRGLEVAFPSDRAREVRTVPLARLPSHEGALAMTVHKSQGSQFDRVALVLAGRASPIQTRELVYTAITRAKQQLLWLGDEGELRAALVRRAERLTLLAERLIARADAEAKK
jgi:exodeoxyribonuclease V alpha subunit